MNYEGKPPYRVSPMSEIAGASGTSGLSVVSSFSGCGGSCLGFEMAGYRIAWASEFIPAARVVYEANHPGVPLDPRDVRLVLPEEILRRAGLERGEADVMEGSPPCASFSLSGNRDADWGKKKKYSDKAQRTDDLFWEFARLVEGVRPRAFVAENVAGLITGKAKGYFKRILSRLRDCGYRVEVRVLDAQWLGVPQRRKRLIFVGTREDTGLHPVFPRPLRYRYSIADACPWMLDGCPLPPDHGDPPPPSLRPYAIGDEWDKLGPGGQSGKYLNLLRPDVGEPCPTVTQTGGEASAASVTHPFEKRKLSLLELRRICGFPDDFVLTGTYQQRWERLGRAVPPPMMRAVAEKLREVLA